MKGKQAIKTNERKSQAIYFSKRSPHDVLQQNRRDIHSVNNVTYLGVMTGRKHGDTISKGL
jgi:hypothetical protein